MLVRVTMLCLLVVTVMAGLSVVLGEVHHYPVVDACNKTLIELIKNHWKETETPTNILKKMGSVRRYVNYHALSEHLTPDFKCVHLDVHNTYFNFTLTLQNGSTPITNQYEVSVSDEGVLYGMPIVPFNDTQYGWSWYVVQVEDGLVLAYVCNNNHVSEIPTTHPSVHSFLAANGFHNETLKQNFQRNDRLMEKWGINLTFTSSSECFTN